jgi:hypothetical protein
MAKKLGLSNSQISHDLKELRERWVVAQLYNVNEQKAKALEQLDAVILNAERSLAKSRLTKDRTRIAGGKNSEPG